MTTTHATVGVAPEWTIGDRLRKAREFAGLDKQGLAEALGISRNTIGSYEAGAMKRYHRPTLMAWAMATGVPLEWIEKGDTSRGPDDTPRAPTNPCLSVIDSTLASCNSFATPMRAA